VLSEGLVQMRGATAPRLLLELMCAQVLLPGASQDHTALLARLERLERGMTTAAPHAATPAGTAPPPASKAPAAQPAPQGRAAPSPRRALPAAPQGPAASTPATPPAAPQANDRPAPESPQAGPPAAPPPAAPSPPPSPPAGPPSGTAALHRDWENVLEAVKPVRRVAWMLLRNASVQSLDDGVLTLRFAREGDVKGFTGSGCDADLQRVLADSFGLKVHIKAMTGAGAPPGPGDGQDFPSSVTVSPQQQAQPAEPASTSPQPAAPAQQAPARQPAPPPEPSPEVDDGDPFDVTDPDASSGEDALTGMDLIRRELGGQVIDEIDNG
jgi:DNA polymerase-3 subunit gamma/tau